MIYFFRVSNLIIEMETKNKVNESLEEIEKNQKSVFQVVGAFTQACLSQGKNILDIRQAILYIIEQKQESVFEVVDAFTQTCLSQGKNISDIQPTILEIIKKNPESVFQVVDAFTEACLSKGKYEELLSNFEDFLKEVKKYVEIKGEIVNSFLILILSKYLNDILFTLKENEEKDSLLKKDRNTEFEKK